MHRPGQLRTSRRAKNHRLVPARRFPRRSSRFALRPFYDFLNRRYGCRATNAPHQDYPSAIYEPYLLSLSFSPSLSPFFARSFHRFHVFKTRSSPHRYPCPSPRNLCLWTTLTLEKREVGNCRFTQSLQGELATTIEQTSVVVSVLSIRSKIFFHFLFFPLLSFFSFSFSPCFLAMKRVAKVGDWKFKTAACWPSREKPIEL